MLHHHRRSLTGVSPVLFLLPFFFLTISSVSQAHNISHLLANHPEFSSFNHYLTITHLDVDINQRNTITVCVVDNAAMNELLDQHLSLFSIKNVLSLHVLLDYFGTQKLHDISNGTVLTATIYQATGLAPGSSGFVNITNLKDGNKVGFAPENNFGTFDSFFVKSVVEIAYNISVIQISKILPYGFAEASNPSPNPNQLNLTGLMSTHGCKAFAETLLASDAEKVFEDNIVGGLSVFCPIDDVFEAFLPNFNNLTVAGKTSLMEFHGVPIYMSISIMKSNNGITNTLATDGAKKFQFTIQNDGQEVTMKTDIDTAKITGTIYDEHPLVIHTIDKVLMPKELLEAEPPAPSPAPSSPSNSPLAGSSPTSELPADSPDDSPADQVKNGSSAVTVGGDGLRVQIYCLEFLLLLYFF